MAGLNKVFLIGRLGKDPASRFTSSGKKVCTYSLAVNRHWKGDGGEQNQATEWFNIETWGRTADVSEEYLEKGSLVFLEGRLQTDRYEKNGEPQSYTKVVVRQLQMLDRRGQAPVESGAEEAAPAET